MADGHSGDQENREEFKTGSRIRVQLGVDEVDWAEECGESQSQKQSLHGKDKGPWAGKLPTLLGSVGAGKAKPAILPHRP